MFGNFFVFLLSKKKVVFILCCFNLFKIFGVNFKFGLLLNVRVIFVLLYGFENVYVYFLIYENGVYDL